MSMAMLIICLVLGVSSFISFLFNRREPTKVGQRITGVLAVISFFAAITSGVLSYWASIETEDQLQLVHTQADRTQAQITEIGTPRRMEPETKRMLVTRLKPYAGQKYDMKVFGDEDSQELASAIQVILEEAGWVYTNVYPKRHAARYAETSGYGVWLLTGKVETRRTSETRMALHDALNEAGLYDDQEGFTPMNCVESTGPLQKGTKITPIPCSESSIQSIKIVYTSHDDVLPEDTLVLHVGKERRTQLENLGVGNDASK